MPDDTYSKTLPGWLEFQADDGNNLTGLLSRAGQLARQQDPCNVLVDTRDDRKLPTTAELFEFGKSLPRQWKIALIVAPTQHEVLDFLEDVATNHGGKLRIFSQAEAARNWLHG